MNVRDAEDIMKLGMRNERFAIPAERKNNTLNFKTMTEQKELTALETIAYVAIIVAILLILDSAGVIHTHGNPPGCSSAQRITDTCPDL